MQDNSPQKTVLLIGASRGLGFAMVEEYLKRGWRVIATGREGSTESCAYARKALRARWKLKQSISRLPTRSPRYTLVLKIDEWMCFL